MNNDLISRKALKEAFKAWKTMDDYYHDSDCNDIPFSEAFDLIDNAPAILSERSQGEWKKIESGSGPYFECSECHHCVDIKYNEINEHLCYIVKDNYCPYCGARMGSDPE